MPKIIWCLHCERTFIKESESDEYECFYPGCDGHIGDLWDWENVRKNHTEYPKTPKQGKVYPLY